MNDLKRAMLRIIEEESDKIELTFAEEAKGQGKWTSNQLVAVSLFRGRLLEALAEKVDQDE